MPENEVISSAERKKMLLEKGIEMRERYPRGTISASQVARMAKMDPIHVHHQFGSVKNFWSEVDIEIEKRKNRKPARKQSAS